MDSPEFVLSTLAAAPPNSSTPYVPRARYCIFRGLWAELPDNKYNIVELNQRIFESEMPTFTTDVRMEKVGHIFASSAGHADSKEQVQGSGGGGPVEAVWWAKPEMTQWRVKGKAFIVGPDIEGDSDSSGVRTVKSELGSRMRCVEPGKEGDWSWQQELDGHFGNNPPGIRGSCSSKYKERIADLGG
jgi:pyridoxamine 5'-phosphate oxidase